MRVVLGDDEPGGYGYLYHSPRTDGRNCRDSEAGEVPRLRASALSAPDSHGHGGGRARRVELARSASSAMDHAMTAPSIIDPTEFLHEQMSQASPDLLRQMLTTFINTLMSTDADAVCGAAWGERSEARTNTRNGYRHRDFDTRASTLDEASRSCATAPTSPTGSSNVAAARNGH